MTELPKAPDRELPRRCYLDLYVPAEMAIYNAMQVVEGLPADTRLSRAVTMLEQAKNLVADYVDGIPDKG